MHWTFAGIAVLALWAGYLTWFALLLTRRVRSAGLRSMPARQQLLALSLDTLLLPVVLLGINFVEPGGHQVSLVPLVLPGLALALWTFAPGYVKSKVAPLSLVFLGLYGFTVLRQFARGVPWVTRYGLAGGGSGPGYAQLDLVQTIAFLAGGLWLTWRRMDPDSRVSRMLLREPDDARAGRGRYRPGLLLLVAYGLIVELLGPTYWLGTVWWSADLTVAVGLATLALVVRWPAIAADLALAALILFGIYGIALAAFWPTNLPLPSPYTWAVRYGAIWVDNRPTAVLAGVQGLALIALGLWLAPRALDPWTRSLFRSAADAELAGRVQRLTRTRADAVDSATAELRRLERDLHDGAQARLVALGMSLRAAERLIPSSPDAAVALVAEARETSLKVLTDLRDLVRGICPPVLADRGLADAIRALALDTPLPTTVDIDLPGRPDLPVETACYFAVAEALANTVKHSGAAHAQVTIRHGDGRLQITIVDDGCGGADPQRGSGLVGLERRLATFDGVLAVNSPPAGPTIIAIEVPCALSSPRISSYSGTA
jgi:signal transduction histidine kinase